MPLYEDKSLLDVSNFLCLITQTIVYIYAVEANKILYYINHMNTSN